MEKSRSFYYPITKRIIKSKNPIEWEILNPVGEIGAYGEVWTAYSQQNDCDYVLKYMPFDTNSREDIINEMEIQDRCADLGLGPKIQDAWLCKDGGAIVMQFFQMTVKQLLRIYKSNRVRDQIIDQVLNLINELHSHRISHGDLHLNNIMVEPENKEVPNGNEEQRYQAHDYHYYFIDFGTGAEFSEPDNYQWLKDYSDVAIDLNSMAIMGGESNLHRQEQTVKQHLNRLIAEINS